MSLVVTTTESSSVGFRKHLSSLVDDKVASRIFSQDVTLWGTEAESESAIRLGWVAAAEESLNLVSELVILSKELQAKGITRVVLCGMGGSSLAPEVIAINNNVELIILDSTYPSQVRRVVDTDIMKTIVIVSSKSGSTVETDSQKRAFEQAFLEAGIDKADRIIVVTDPGSPMEKQARTDGCRVFLANPKVGGRYSALTAFGVVPSVLSGVDMQVILQDAIDATSLLAEDSDKNPALILGAALARTSSKSGYKDKFGVVSCSKNLIGFGDWLEQLVAESTGKLGRGVLPVVLDKNSPELSSQPDDMFVISLGDSDVRADVRVSGTLGEQMLLWEVATAVASRLLGVNPFDQPDVESAKAASRVFLDNGTTAKRPFVDDVGIAISAKNLDISDDVTLLGAMEALLASAKSDSYFSVHAYLDPLRHIQVMNLRDQVAEFSKRPTTFGWGPRFLHSTGQYHKGGPSQGVFLQLIGDEGFELEVPGRDFSFQELMRSQAAGDANVLKGAGRPVLTLEFQNVDDALGKVAGAIKLLASKPV